MTDCMAAPNHFIVYASGKGKTAITDALTAVLQKVPPALIVGAEVSFVVISGGATSREDMDNSLKTVSMVCNKAERINGLMCKLTDASTEAGTVHVLCSLVRACGGEGSMAMMPEADGGKTEIPAFVRKMRHKITAITERNDLVCHALPIIVLFGREKTFILKAVNDGTLSIETVCFGSNHLVRFLQSKLYRRLNAMANSCSELIEFACDMHAMPDQEIIFEGQDSVSGDKISCSASVHEILNWLSFAWESILESIICTIDDIAVGLSTSVCQNGVTIFGPHKNGNKYIAQLLRESTGLPVYASGNVPDSVACPAVQEDLHEMARSCEMQKITSISVIQRKFKLPFSTAKKVMNLLKSK